MNTLPQIRVDYGFETLLDPDGVNILINNINVLNNILLGHLVSKIYKHTSTGIIMESEDSLYDTLVSMNVILQEYDGQASSIANKALALKNKMQETVDKLKEMKVLTINGKEGNLRLVGMKDIVVGTAPADNNIIINNTQSSEVQTDE